MLQLKCRDNLNFFSVFFSLISSYKSYENQLVSRAGICLWVLFWSVKMAADSIISCLDNERVYLSIVICTVFYIATWPPCAKSLPLSFSCEESDHSQITQFCCRLAGSPFILNQDKIHFWRDSTFPYFQSSMLSFSDMQAMAKAGKIICFVHEFPRLSTFTIAKTP